MHSPRFKAKIKSLANSINETSLTESWKKKVRNDLKRQIIPDTVEYLDIHVNKTGEIIDDVTVIRIANAITTARYTICGDNFTKIRNFLKAPNQSYINGLTHEKFGMILGFLSNPSYTKIVKANLISNHPLMMTDYYYSKIISKKMNSLP